MLCLKKSARRASMPKGMNEAADEPAMVFCHIRDSELVASLKTPRQFRLPLLCAHMDARCLDKREMTHLTKSPLSADVPAYSRLIASPFEAQTVRNVPSFKSTTAKVLRTHAR